jgi:hypothetical protein
MAGLSPQVASQLLKHKDKILKDEKKLQKAYADLVEIDKNIKS